MDKRSAQEQPSVHENTVYPSSYPIQEDTVQQSSVQEFTLYQQTHPEPTIEVSETEPTVKVKGTKLIVPTHQTV